MKKFLVAMAWLWFGFPAFAADMPVKALPKFTTAYPYAGSGIYCGVGTHGEAQKIDVTSPLGTPASTFAAGGTLDVGCGYTYTLSPNRWVAFEGFISYANTGANQGLVDVSTKFSATQRAMYGGDMSMLTQWLPNLSTILPVLPPLPAASICPAGQTCNPLSHPYVAAVLREARDEVTIGGLTEKKFRMTYGLGAGLITQMADGSAVDTWTDATSSSGAHLAGVGVGAPVVAKTGVTYRAGVTYKFGISKN